MGKKKTCEWPRRTTIGVRLQQRPVGSRTNMHDLRLLGVLIKRMSTFLIPQKGPYDVGEFHKGTPKALFSNHVVNHADSQGQSPVLKKPIFERTLHIHKRTRYIHMSRKSPTKIELLGTHHALPTRQRKRASEREKEQTS